MAEPLPPDEVEQAPERLNVVRGGTLSTPEGIRAAQQNAARVEHAYGRPGLCVALGQGMTVEEAVRSKPLRNPQLVVTDTDRLALNEWEVTPEPGSHNPHAGIIWLPDREVETLTRLAASFDVVDSPLSPQERKAL